MNGYFNALLLGLTVGALRAGIMSFSAGYEEFLNGVEAKIRNYYAETTYKPESKPLDSKFRDFLIRSGVPYYRADYFSTLHIYNPELQLPPDILILYNNYKTTTR